jgi:hypothetical protein
VTGAARRQAAFRRRQPLLIIGLKAAVQRFCSCGDSSISSRVFFAAASAWSFLLS